MEHYFLTIPQCYELLLESDSGLTVNQAVMTQNDDDDGQVYEVLLLIKLFSVYYSE